MAENPQSGGGKVVDPYDFIGDPQQLDIDHYDFIDAPQYVDFENITEQDDPDADKFFETHREEDDFMIALDVNAIQQSVDLSAISPTVQLLYNEVQYENQANKAAKDAGLDDVKIEYYSSPQHQQSLSTSQSSSAHKRSLSAYGTPLGGSGLSSQASFYTPTGGEDKENKTPTTTSASAKKFDKNGSEEKGLRGILAERKIEAVGGVSSVSLCYTPSSNVTPEAIKKIKGKVDATQSLYSQLDKLRIVSSDEDDAIDDDKTPVPQPPNGSYSSFSSEKLSFLDLPQPVQPPLKVMENDCIGDTSQSDLDTTQLVESPSHAPLLKVDKESKDESGSDDSFLEGGSFSGGMELRTPVRNILKKLDAELHLDDDKNNADGPRCSILVAPSVGQQVHWGGDSATPEKSNNMPPYNAPQGDSSFAESHNDSYDFNISATSSIPYDGRRASSVGNLPLAVELEPKERNFRTFGYNPRVGITIPKTPDVPTRTPERPEVYQCENVVPVPSEMVSSKNSCYFEIEAPPKKATNLRRVSSCGDLHKYQQTRNVGRSVQQKFLLSSAKKPLTIPKTPEVAKRTRRTGTANNGSNMSSASSSCSNAGGRGRVKATKTGPTVAERLAAARSRQPIKANHYVSMAEAMIKYQQNTPDRFRSLPKGRVVPEKRSASCDARKRHAPTPPRSPEFATAARQRNSSTTQKDSNDNCKTSGPTLPQRLELKPTVPKPFNFSSSHRPRTAPVKNDVDVVDSKFKARPAPAKPREEPATIKLKPAVKVTQPMSPHFASDDRLKERHQKKAQANTVTPPKAKSGKPVASKNPRVPPAPRPIHHVEEHKTTIAQAFSSSFEARQKDVLRRKEEKIKVLEQEAKISRTFHANPVPKFNPKPIKKKPVEVTQAEPFHLMSDERGAAYQEAFRRKLEEEEERLKAQAKFHAQPADVLHKPPFEPERTSRTFEGPLDIHLATEKRAAEREQYDQHLREKEREEEERRRQEQAILEELQKQEDLERRRQMVHKAQPFKEPKPFQVKSSNKPLTVPQSPAFSALPSQRRVHGPDQTFSK